VPRRQRLGGRDELGEAAGETMRWRWMQVESKTGVEAEARAAGAASRESGGGCRERRRKGGERERERERTGVSGVVGFVVWTGEGCFRKMSCGRFSVKTTRVHDFSLLHVEIKFTTGT